MRPNSFFDVPVPRHTKRRKIITESGRVDCYGGRLLGSEELVIKAVERWSVIIIYVVLKELRI